MLKKVLLDYITGIFALYRGQPSLYNRESVNLLKKMITSALSYLPRDRGQEGIDVEISGLSAYNENGFPVIPTLRIKDKGGKIYGYLQVVDPYSRMNSRLDTIPPGFKRMYLNTIYTNLFEFMPCQGERVRNIIRPFSISSAVEMSGVFQVKLFRVFLHSLENLLLRGGSAGNNSSFTDMQRQLAFKTFYLRQYVLKPLLTGIENRFATEVTEITASDNYTTPPLTNHHSPLLSAKHLLSIYQNYCAYFQETLNPGDFSAFLAHVIMDGLFKASILNYNLQNEGNKVFSRTGLGDYSRFNGMPSRRVDLFQWLSADDGSLPGSLKWLVDDMAWCLSGFNFRQMGFATTNPGIIPVEQLQWDEYFFLPYYDITSEIARAKVLLKREGIPTDSPA